MKMHLTTVSDLYAAQHKNFGNLANHSLANYSSLCGTAQKFWQFGKP
jgi:hypothetical protein